MSDTADNKPAPAPTAEPVCPDWFTRIEFDAKKGLDGVLPMALTEIAPPNPPSGQHGQSIEG
jgi:hypothetical protein